MKRFLVCGFAGLCFLVPAPLFAQDKEVVGFWRQLIRQPGLPGWVRAGLLQVELREGMLVMEDLAFAAPGRTIGPKSLTGAKAAGLTWTFRGSYTGAVIDFRLKRVAPGIYEGTGFVRGKPFSPLRLEKIAGTKELIAEYREVRDQLKLEIALSEALIPLFRRGVQKDRLRAEIDDLAVRLGLGRGPTTVEMLGGIFRLGDLVNEQKRLVELNQKMNQITLLLAKLEKLEEK